VARQIRGNGYVIVDRSNDYLRAANNATERAIAATTIAVQAETKRLLNLKTGPIKSFPDKPPSAPGEPPAKRTGTLGRSIDQETLERRRGRGREFIGRVGTNVKYGFWLELGTRKMAARPYLRPALRAKSKMLPGFLRRAWNRIRRV
jgi:hypothetical protein